MPFRLRRSLCVTLASLGLPGMALADTGHLTWQHKSEPQTVAAPTVSSGGQDYAVPPSPYGQVGDPFARTLNWSGKGRTQPSPRPEAQPHPVAVAPVQPPYQAPRQAPARPAEPPRRDLANIDPLPVPQHPVPQVTAPIPVPQPRPVTVPEAALKPDPRPPGKPQAAPSRAVPQAPAVATAKPVPAQPVTPVLKPAPPAASQAAPTQTASAGYQVPANSKYAARIASARAAAAKQEADATPPATAAPAKPAGKTDKKAEAAKATVPAPTPQMATEETDHVFIPGEQYKNASDAPRLYSLHRAYGLTPDPITVDHNATGAILDTADLDKVEEAKDDKSKDDKSSSEEKTGDDTSETDDSTPAKTADAHKADTRKVTQ